MPLWPVLADADCTLLRYPLLSARKAEILAEARVLADQGCQEITLLGQTIDTYDSGFKEALPTGVTIASFEATARGTVVVVTWESATEAGTLGFNVYRSTAVEGGFVKVNERLIATRGGTVLGATYRLEDAPGGGTFHYRLDVVDASGASERYGPIEVAVAR